MSRAESNDAYFGSLVERAYHGTPDVFPAIWEVICHSPEIINQSYVYGIKKSSQLRSTILVALMGGISVNNHPETLKERMDLVESMFETIGLDLLQQDADNNRLLHRLYYYIVSAKQEAAKQFFSQLARNLELKIHATPAAAQTFRFMAEARNGERGETPGDAVALKIPKESDQFLVRLGSSTAHVFRLKKFSDFMLLLQQFMTDPYDNPIGCESIALGRDIFSKLSKDQLKSEIRDDVPYYQNPYDQCWYKPKGLPIYIANLLGSIQDQLLSFGKEPDEGKEYQIIGDILDFFKKYMPAGLVNLRITAVNVESQGYHAIDTMKYLVREWITQRKKLREDLKNFVSYQPSKRPYPLPTQANAAIAVEEISEEAWEEAKAFEARVGLRSRLRVMHERQKEMAAEGRIDTSIPQRNTLERLDLRMKRGVVTMTFFPAAQHLTFHPKIYGKPRLDQCAANYKLMKSAGSSASGAGLSRGVLEQLSLGSGSNICIATEVDLGSADEVPSLDYDHQRTSNITVAEARKFKGLIGSLNTLDRDGYGKFEGSWASHESLPGFKFILQFCPPDTSVFGVSGQGFQCSFSISGAIANVSIRMLHKGRLVSVDSRSGRDSVLAYFESVLRKQSKSKIDNNYQRARACLEMGDSEELQETVVVTAGEKTDSLPVQPDGVSVDSGFTEISQLVLKLLEKSRTECELREDPRFWYQVDDQLGFHMMRLPGTEIDYVCISNNEYRVSCKRAADGKISDLKVVKTRFNESQHEKYRANQCWLSEDPTYLDVIEEESVPENEHLPLVQTLIDGILGATAFENVGQEASDHIKEMNDMLLWCRMGRKYFPRELELRQNKKPSQWFYQSRSREYNNAYASVSALRDAAEVFSIHRRFDTFVQKVRGEFEKLFDCLTHGRGLVDPAIKKDVGLSRRCELLEVQRLDEDILLAYLRHLYSKLQSNPFSGIFAKLGVKPLPGTTTAELQDAPSYSDFIKILMQKANTDSDGVSFKLLSVLIKILRDESQNPDVKVLPVNLRMALASENLYDLSNVITATVLSLDSGADAEKRRRVFEGVAKPTYESFMVFLKSYFSGAEISDINKLFCFSGQEREEILRSFQPRLSQLLDGGASKEEYQKLYRVTCNLTQSHRMQLLSLLSEEQLEAYFNERKNDGLITPINLLETYYYLLTAKLDELQSLSAKDRVAAEKLIKQRKEVVISALNGRDIKGERLVIFSPVMVNLIDMVRKIVADDRLAAGAGQLGVFAAPQSGGGGAKQESGANPGSGSSEGGGGVKPQ